MKFCPRCKVSLDESQFYPDSRARTGLASCCIECEKSRKNASSGFNGHSGTLGIFGKRMALTRARTVLRQMRIAQYGLAVVEAEEALKGVEE